MTAAKRERRPLAVGDRVAVYDGGARHVARVMGYGADVDGTVLVEVEGDITGHVHRRQCVRLVPKRRREWILARHSHTGAWQVFGPEWQQPHNEPFLDVVRVREVVSPGGSTASAKKCTHKNTKIWEPHLISRAGGIDSRPAEKNGKNFETTDC
jgi:hypothetical protein